VKYCAWLSPDELVLTHDTAVNKIGRPLSGASKKEGCPAALIKSDTAQPSAPCGPKGRTHEQLASGELSFQARMMGGGSAGRTERLLPLIAEISNRFSGEATQTAPGSAETMAGAVMQPASHMQSMPEAGHGIPCPALPIPGSLREDIDMLSSADMLIAHGIIAVDANACDAPKRKSASANAVVKNRRTVTSLSMSGTLVPSQIGVKHPWPKLSVKLCASLFNVRLIPLSQR
jgi:hypothetical protein